jgi:hypothetical protein
LDSTELADAYQNVQELAPNRHASGKKYFVGHTGITSAGETSTRREEHLAVALWNAAQEKKPLTLPDGEELNLLDYQFPLKATQGDKGIGKVDLFGVIGGVRSCVIELKIHPAGNGRSDTPLRAFLEGLAYCAIIEANAADIALETQEKFGLRITMQRPALVVMAPAEYWAGYLDNKWAGDWWSALLELSSQLAASLGLETHFIALRNSDFLMGLDGQKPRLLGECSLVNVGDLA